MLSVVVPIILYMTTLSLAEARADFSKIVGLAEATHERFEITKNGQRAAVVLGVDDYDSIMETLEILSDSKLMSDIKEGVADLRSGESYSMDQVLQELRKAGRIK